MTRKGHKEGCQCIVCKQTTKAATFDISRDIIPTVIVEDVKFNPLPPHPSPPAPPPVPKVSPPPPAPPTLGSLNIGVIFEFKGTRYRRGINDGGVIKVISLDNPGIGIQVFGPETIVNLIK